MTEESHQNETDRGSELERVVQERELGLLAEYWHFLRVERKWWLAPILLVLLVSGTIIFVGGTSIAPFIYALF